MWQQVHWVNASLCAVCTLMKSRGWAFYAGGSTLTKFVCDGCADAITNGVGAATFRDTEEVTT